MGKMPPELIRRWAGKKALDKKGSVKGAKEVLVKKKKGKKKGGKVPPGLAAFLAKKGKR